MQLNQLPEAVEMRRRHVTTHPYDQGLPICIVSGQVPALHQSMQMGTLATMTASQVLEAKPPC